jgi:hypothetical protein
MQRPYDIFISHAWVDGELPRRIADELTALGLHVWIDAVEINDFASITRAVTEGLAQSKALLAYYSKTYPLRRACQWELTAAFLAAQAEGDPRRRVLVVNPEQKPDHIHPIELRDARLGTAPTDDGPSLRDLVQSITKHVSALDGLLADIHPLSAPSWYGTTPVGSTRFVGRFPEMWQIHSLLHEGDVAQITGASVASRSVGQVYGLGGLGKSLLAEEYALRFGTAYPGGVFWLRAFGSDDRKRPFEAEEQETVRTVQIRNIAEQMRVSTDGLSAPQISSVLADVIEQEGKACLWVVDDVPSRLGADTVRSWFAPHSLARTLITTRSRGYGSLAKGIDLSVLPPEDAYTLLTSRRQPLDEAAKEQAHQLTKALGYHPLALDVSSAALVSYGSDAFRSFREELNRQDQDALELAAEIADVLPNGHEVSIAQTMLGSIRRLGGEGCDFLRLASVLAQGPISASLVAGVFERADGIDSVTAVQRQRRAFHQTTTASLSEIPGETSDARSVHALVSRTMRFSDRHRSRTRVLRNATIDLLIEVLEAGAVTPPPYLEHILKLIAVLRVDDVMKAIEMDRVSFLSALAVVWNESKPPEKAMYVPKELPQLLRIARQRRL